MGNGRKHHTATDRAATVPRGSWRHAEAALEGRNERVEALLLRPLAKRPGAVRRVVAQQPGAVR